MSQKLGRLVENYALGLGTVDPSDTKDLKSYSTLTLIKLSNSVVM